MKTIFFFILIIGSLATVLGKSLSNCFEIHSASLKRFGLQGDFVSKGRCDVGLFDIVRRRQLHCVSADETYKFSLTPLHLSGLELSSNQLNINTSLGVVKDNTFDPSLIRYSINKPSLKFERDMKSFNDGRYTTFGNAYLVYGLARDLGFIHW